MRLAVLLFLLLAGCSTAKNDKIVFDADLLDWSLGPNADKPFERK